MRARNHQHKIKLNGIEAPELGQPFGRASKHHPAGLLADCEAVAKRSKTDRYRREICGVLIGGADVGLVGVTLADERQIQGAEASSLMDC